MRISGFWIRRAIDTAISLGVSRPGLCLSMSHLVLALLESPNSMRMCQILCALPHAWSV